MSILARRRRPPTCSAILYKLKLNQQVTTIPTVGFNVETVTYKNVKVRPLPPPLVASMKHARAVIPRPPRF